MLDSGADPNQVNSDGRSALHLLAWRFSEEGPYAETTVALVRLLAARGANLNLKDRRGNTALMDAAWMGNGRVVDALLAAGADVSVRSNRGDSAVYYASSKGNVAILRKLLDANAPSDGPDIVTGDTPLHLAVRDTMDPDLTRLLLEHGASVNRANCAGDTPLLLATANWFDDIVKSMLDRGADPNATNDKGDTPLKNAVKLAFANDARTNPKILEALLSTPTLAFDKQSDAAKGALVVLSGLGRIAAVTSLLDRGVSATSLYERTSPVLAWSRGGPVSTSNYHYPEQASIDQNLVPMLDLLVARSSDVNAPDGAPLIRAVAAQDLDKVRLLTARHADPNARAPGKAPALFFAMRTDIEKQDTLIRSMLSAGADPNVTMQNGITVLMYTFVSPFMGDGVAGHAPHQVTAGFHDVLHAVSDATLWAKVGGTNAVEIAVDETGIDYNMINAATRGGELIAEEMSRRLANRPSTCVCSAKMPDRVRTTAPTCDAARAALDTRLANYVGRSFADPICWREPAN